MKFFILSLAFLGYAQAATPNKLYLPPATGALTSGNPTPHQAAAASTVDLAFKAPEPAFQAAAYGHIVPSMHTVSSFSAPSIAAMHSLGNKAEIATNQAASAPSRDYVPPPAQAPAPARKTENHFQSAASTDQANSVVANTKISANKNTQHGHSHAHSPFRRYQAANHHQQQQQPSATASSAAPQAQAVRQFSGYPATAATNDFVNRASAAAAASANNAPTHSRTTTAHRHHQQQHQQRQHIATTSGHQNAATQFNGHPAAAAAQQATNQNFEKLTPAAAQTAQATRTAPAVVAVAAHQSQTSSPSSSQRSSGHSTEIGTQYAANGGYVYRRHRR